MHMFRPTKAIIAVAGFGTRWLPYTKAIEKCMVPIMSRPWIDYIVEDCINVGITHIYFVVNKRHAQLKQYYSENLEIEEYNTYIAGGIWVKTEHRAIYSTKHASEMNQFTSVFSLTFRVFK